MQVLAQDLNNNFSQNSTNEVISTSNGIDQSFLVIFDKIVIYINYFVLAFSVFYTIIALMDFFEYRIYNGGAKLNNEKKGIKAINLAINIWRRYLPVVIFYLFAHSLRNSVFGYFALSLALIVLILKFWRDLIEISELFNYFSWSKSFMSKLRKTLEIKK
jgi:hypothetical protein